VATQIHHARHWAHGGTTCLPNLISVCAGHHWLVHEGAFTLVPRDGGWALLSLDGIRVGPHPELTEATEPLPTDPGIDADAVTGHWDGTRLRAADAVNLLLHLDVPPRPTAEERPEADDDVSAETWEPIDWPIHDDYDGAPYVGYDDPFAAW
jgi:hypothetical protein